MNGSPLFSAEEMGIATVWLEAEGEPQVGKLGVAFVIVNRMKRLYSSDGTVHGTVLRPFQFSGWALQARVSKLLGLGMLDPAVADCRQAWEDAMAGVVTDPTGGAVLYYAPGGVTSAPAWVANCRQTAQLGNQLFFVPL